MAPIFQIFPIPFGNRPPRWIPLTEGFKGTVLANFLPAIIHQSNLVKKTTHLVSHSQSFYFKIWLFLLRHAVKCSTVKIQQKVRNIPWKMQQRDLTLSCYLQHITLIWRCQQIAEIFYYKLHSTVGTKSFCCHAADGEMERFNFLFDFAEESLSPPLRNAAWRYLLNGGELPAARHSGNMWFHVALCRDPPIWSICIHCTVESSSKISTVLKQNQNRKYF